MPIGGLGYGGGQRDASASSAAASTAAPMAQRDARHAEDKLDRLALINMAMWSLMQDKLGHTEEDLMERVQLLDQMDGSDDGKATRSVSQCRACGRPMGPRHRKCMYCGKARAASSAFDTL
jgi:hypothetical protein